MGNKNSKQPDGTTEECEKEQEWDMGPKPYLKKKDL